MAWNFAKEDDVKEYIENLGIEYRFSCYHEKSAEGCHLLGDYMEAIKKDFPAAASIYRMNCKERNFGLSCNKYGGYLLNGKGCSVNKKEALEHFEKGCEVGCAKACFGAGVMEASSWENHQPDARSSMSYFERGCDGNDPRACFHASGIYIKGTESIPKNSERAFRLSEKACALGDARSCANVSIMYSRGEGVMRSEERAAEYKKAALDIRDQNKGNFTPIEFS